jgi:hypothetical protein
LGLRLEQQRKDACFSTGCFCRGELLAFFWLVILSLTRCKSWGRLPMEYLLFFFFFFFFFFFLFIPYVLFEDIRQAVLSSSFGVLEAFSARS